MLRTKAKGRSRRRVRRSGRTPFVARQRLKAFPPLSSQLTETLQKLSVTVREPLSEGEKKERKTKTLKDGDFELILYKEHKEVPDLKVLRGLFAADQPYTTKIGLFSAVATSSAGVLGYSIAASSLSSASEWSTLNTLFDEVFIHGFKLIFEPINHCGEAIGVSVSGATQNSLPTGATAPVLNVNCGLIIAPLYAASGSYGTAAAMIANPATEYHRMTPFEFWWRNNVEYDPHGMTLAPLTAVGWQGWCQVADIANYGGTVNLRTVNDVALGDLTHAVTLGHFVVEYYVSFRSRV